MQRGLVSCEWLRQGLQGRAAEQLRLLDATWFLPNSPFACPVAGSTAATQFARGPRLPGARFFDVDAVSDPHSALPHMMPTAPVLASALARLGVSREHDVVVYDQLGIFSAPRAWYTLKAFGHPSVAVLDGGLPQWLREGGEVESGEPADHAPLPREESWALNGGMVWDLGQVSANLQSPGAQVVDARGAPRFSGTAPEPREGMRSGRIPGSLNVPFATLLTEGQTMKSGAELSAVFAAAGLELDGQRRVVTSCGSGLTACIVGLALKQAGFPVESRWAVYDGSWSEYGARSDTRVVKDGPGGMGEVEVPGLPEAKL